MKYNPPVTEVALSIQFESLGELTVLDYAHFFEQFRDRFPVLQQVAPIPQIFVDDAVQIPQFQLMGKPEMPRIWCVSSDLRQLVQFQNDRVSFNWRRLAPVSAGEPYPGYATLIAEFVEIFAKVVRWANERLGQEIRPTVGELLYIDVIPMMKEDGTKRRLSEIFSFYKASTPPRAISGFNSSWRETIVGPPRGRIQIQAFVTAQADGTPAAAMHFTSRVDLAAVQGNPESWFADSHARILELFRILLIYEAENS